MLRHIGVAKVRGFMLNVTHHDWTSSNIAYGRKVSRRIGGKPFVVSTSYNGRGPVHYKLGNEGPLPARERVLQPALPRPRARADHQHRRRPRSTPTCTSTVPACPGAGSCNGGLSRPACGGPSGR